MLGLCFCFVLFLVSSFHLFQCPEMENINNSPKIPVGTTDEDTLLRSFLPHVFVKNLKQNQVRKCMACMLDELFKELVSCARAVHFTRTIEIFFKKETDKA
jgi:hypothetical protein